MNLVETMGFLKDQIEKLEKANADESDIAMYMLFLNWLDDLFKYRLMFSEIQNEISLSKRNVFPKQWLLDFFKNEMKDWELYGKEFDE